MIFLGYGGKYLFRETWTILTVILLSLYRLVAEEFPHPEIKHYPGQGLYNSFVFSIFFLPAMYCGYYIEISLPSISIDFSHT